MSGRGHNRWYRSLRAPTSAAGPLALPASEIKGLQKYKEPRLNAVQFSRPKTHFYGEHGGGGNCNAKICCTCPEGEIYSWRSDRVWLMDGATPSPGPRHSWHPEGPLWPGGGWRRFPWPVEIMRKNAKICGFMGENAMTRNWVKYAGKCGAHNSPLLPASPPPQPLEKLEIRDSDGRKRGCLQQHLCTASQFPVFAVER